MLIVVKLTAIILTKNEEKNIERCLKSVDFCDEVIVVDDFSEDKTVELVNKVFKVHKVDKDYKVFQRKLNNDFAMQRNFAMEKASGEWVLFIDADEEVTQELKNEISRVILNSFLRAQDYSLIQDLNQIPNQVRNDIGAYYLKRRDFWWGRELNYGETSKVRQVGLIRLIRKNSGKWEGKVHEEFRIKNSELKIKLLNNFINHYPHQNVKEFLEEINFYSTLRAREMRGQGKNSNIFEIIFYPLLKFLLTYIVKLGFLDGSAGFAYAFFMSFHSFLVRAKLYRHKT
ncbi:hypothetical protein A3B40_02330 [Candidatus Roizmanbacteria bacterium RIFCSPLOWO2_01_FULL_37_16]|uniref:Glycosyltransferase 2-like domain-containing protein n=1 Tax=Candidatus Roizmanbacteria bacterium RIFCSPLOWO2_01_FULL_37_16 TaxID=1802058 RepID=A0A1F7IIW0_9BACT|nr:MAG: hypothetical protein A3B40_02330 [Candidatus Roizmanbacteria bacterium RIFCSPLOWO2_01_FULL_37_16]